MKTITYNDNNLNDNEMTEIVKRVKLLLVNSKSEIMLGYSHHDYQFPGGHVDEGETLLDTVHRELKEETGIELDVKDLKPFAAVYGYYKDWPVAGKNRKIEIYYYEIKTDEKANLENTSYTSSEQEGGFELRSIPLNEVEQELLDNVKIHGDKHGITKEMLEIIKEYKAN